MRKKNICLSVGLSVLLATNLSGCVTINVQTESIPSTLSMEDSVGSSEILDNGESLESSEVLDNGESLESSEILDNSESLESSEILDNSSLKSPLLFSDYESNLNNTDGRLFFVNEEEFVGELKPLHDAYTLSSQSVGVVTVVESNNIVESFAFRPNTSWSVVKDNVYRINELNSDSHWETVEYLDGNDNKTSLSISSNYDSGFDFLLNPDEVVFEFIEVRSLGLGDYLYVCDYANKDGSSGLMEFKVSSNGLLTYIKKSPVSNESNLVDFLEYRIVYNSSNDGSYNDGLLTYYNLISSIDNSSLNVIDSYKELKNKSVGGFNILNRDVYVDASNLLMSAYNKSSSLDFCMKYYKYSDIINSETLDGELLSEILGYSSDNSYWYHKLGNNLSIISLEEDADGNKSWLGSKYNHNGDTEDLNFSFYYDSVLDSILKTDDYTFIITSVEENVSKDIKGKENELFTLVHLNYLYNGISGPMDIHINSDGTIYSISMVYGDNLYISVFTNINDSSYNELKSDIITNSLSIENKDLNSIKKILNQLK